MYLHAVVATVDQRQGLEHQGKGSSARSITSAGSGTLLAAAPAGVSQNQARERSAAPPSTAPSSLPGPSSRHGDNAAVAGLVLPVSPQQQQRWGATPAPAPDTTVDEEEDNDNRDENADAGASCATSAVTIPRAAWAEEGDSILNDVFFEGGSGNANDNGSAAAASAASLGAGEGTGPMPGEGSWSPPAADAEAMSGLWHGEQRCAGGPGCEPKQAAFGKASTKV